MKKIAALHFFNDQWKDTKLLNLAIEKGPRPGVNTTMNSDILVPVNMELIKHIWKPTIFISNIKIYKVQDVLDSILAVLWIAANKMLLFSQETENTTYLCPIRFYNFPLDTQVY